MLHETMRAPLRSKNETLQVVRIARACEFQYCRTALWHAACRGHEAVTRLLLDRGASVNHQDVRGSTALHEAALHGQQQIAEILIERGANIDLPDFVSYTSKYRLLLPYRFRINSSLGHSNHCPA